MIRLIGAIDSKRGIADEDGIPWHLPSDSHYYREKVKGQTVLMGYGTYVGYSKPPSDGRNIVITHHCERLHAGFEAVHDLDIFLKGLTEDVWVLGGAQIFEQTIKWADELYLTQVEGDFNCTKFFPPFQEEFMLQTHSEPQTENGHTFRFEIWKRALNSR